MNSRLLRPLSIDALRKVWPIGRKLTLLALMVLLALLLPWFGYLHGLELAGRKTLFILILAMGLWVSEAIPPFATALLIIGFQVFVLYEGGAGDPALIKYTQAWSSPVMWLLMGGFFLSLGISLSGLDRSLFKIIIGILGRNSKRLTLGIMLTTATLSFFVSNTATTALMLSILGPTLALPNQRTEIKKMLVMCIPTAAAIGGLITLVGSPPNAIAYGFLLSHGVEFGFFPWMVMGIPIAFVLLPIIWFLATKIFKLPDIDIVISSPEVGGRLADQKVQRRDRIAVVIVTAVTVTLWATAPWHQISVSVASLVPIVGLTVTGVVRSQDIRFLPWDTLLLIMGGMSLGDSVIESGLGTFVLNSIDMPTHLPMLMYLLIGFITVIFSTIMSSTAAAAILIPLWNALVPGHMLQVSLITSLCCSIGTSLPVSTPPNAIAYASGYIDAKDFSKIGIALGLIGTPVIVAAVIFIVPMLQ